MGIREEFFIERKGVRMVLFAGLLDAAHQQGIKSIDTELIQVPGADNSSTAICKAVVEMEGGARYSGIGDASPESVGKMIQAHLIRMAETRAKARALRDAVNVGAVSLEEMGEDHPEEKQAPQSQSSQASETPERTEGGATRRQLNYMLSLLPDHRKKQLEAEHGPVERWSRDAVRAMIDKLKPQESG